MARLTEIEKNIIQTLSQATVFGERAFHLVRGISGGYRASVRAALQREPLPAAYVAFIEEPTAPEVRPAIRGPRFAIIIAAGSLRLESDPRIGDGQTAGAFDLVDSTRSALDGHSPLPGLELVNLRARFLEADERVVFYEILYRAWPIVEDAPTLFFGGEVLLGSMSRMAIEVGSRGADEIEFVFHGGSSAYRRRLGPSLRPIVWHGSLRGLKHADLDAIESRLDGLVDSGQEQVMSDGRSRKFPGCVLAGYFRRGDRVLDGGDLSQACSLLFLQK